MKKNLINKMNKINKNNYYLLFLISFFVFFIIKNSFSLNEKFYKTSSEMKHRIRKDTMRPYVYSFFKKSDFPTRPKTCKSGCKQYREVARQFEKELIGEDVECGIKESTCKEVKTT